MDEEEEICRVCRGEATLEEPLFHPCKCAGSIRFVHQKCLLDWLSHSKKKYCELCNHHYEFTPVYKSDMPAKIPTSIFIQHLKRWIYKLFSLSLRAMLVLFVWLVFVPYITFWIWRFYFWNANTTRYLFTHYIIGSTYHDEQHNPVVIRGRAEKIMHDCLRGWLISFIVLLIFVAGFLLREWIIQNVPAELQDDVDGLLESVQEEDVRTDVLLEHQESEPEESEPEESEPEEPEVVEPESREPEAGEPNIEEQHETIDDSIPSVDENLQENIHRIRRHNARRPLLHEEPSDYENLEAMWLADEEQQNGNVTSIERHFFDLDVGNEDEEDDDGYFDESEEEEVIHSENMQEFLNYIQQDHFMRQDDEDAIVENNDDMANAPNDDDALRAGGPEDMDGILEAIGMKGSLFILFQNSGIIILLMCLGLGIGIWLPYTLGIFFITLKPWEPSLILTGYFLQFLSTSILIPLYNIWLRFYSQLDPIMEWLPSWTPIWIRSIILAALHIGQSLLRFFWTMNIATRIGTDEAFISASSSDILLGPSTQSHTISLWRDLVSGWQCITPASRAFFDTYSRMSNGVTGMDRAGCILTGYIILVIIGSFYLSKTRGMYARIGRTARQIIRQLGIFLKVLFFITIELTLFPLGCGLLLDAVGLSLFYKIGGGGGAAGHLLAIHRRITFLRENMTSSIFMHWAVGTGFMFLFTSMVTFCRDIVRPGVIWFIRDPNDPQFNPIKELVERPFLTQLQKIGASAVIYGFVIEVGVGGLVAAIGSIFDGILPLKWSYTQPFMIIPFDLLVVMIVIPAMVHYFDPKKLLENLMIRWTTWLCHQLRLTSFLLGGRPIREEGHIRYNTWRAWIQRPELIIKQEDDGNEGEQDVTFVRNGQLVRAPNHDGVRFVPGRRMLVPVDPVTLQAIDLQERQLGHPAAKTREEEEENTTIVYIPPQFNLRLATFMIVIWVSWSALLCYIFVGPIAVGRWLFNYFGIVAQPGKKIHDIYAYCFGGATIISIGFIVKKMKTFVLSSSPINRENLVQGIHWIFNFCVILTSFGIVFPMILGWIFQLYIIIPLQNWGTKAPIINVFVVWSNGVVCLTLFHFLLSKIPNNELYTSFVRVASNHIMYHIALLTLKQ
ncbi:MAG: hypothetical protein EXX96DRAFT_568239 [Benjaminiella poitrasii]|nr:MAG: hypothetical protein EXX96DRAFT_568239 [Benjaminiella poitrasii]